MALDVALVDLDPALPHLSSPGLMPRHLILSVGTTARRAGHNVSVFVECLNGVPYEFLKTQHVVGAPITVCCHNRVRDLFMRLRQDRPGIKLVAGGPHATLIPSDVLDFADVAVRDEGEGGLTDLLNAWERDADLAGIPGISYRHDGRVVHNPRRPFLGEPGLVEDLDLLKGFRRRSRPVQLARGGGLYRVQAAASRGCPFPCTFCYENMIGGTGYRTTPPPVFVEDIRRKIDFFGVRDVWLADSNFGADPERCKALLRAIIDARLDCTFSAPARVDIARDPGLLPMMREAGFVWLVVGLETVRNDQLAAMKKQQTVSQMEDAIRRMHANDIAVYGFFMVGFDGDTANTPRQVLDFCLRNDVDGMSYFGLVEYAPRPGQTLPRHRICELNYDYYSGHFVTTFPKQVPPSVLEREMFDGLKEFFSLKRCVAAVARRDKRRALIALPYYVQVRRLARISARHQRLLREREAPYYNAAGELDEALLRRQPLVGAGGCHTQRDA